MRFLIKFFSVFLVVFLSGIGYAQQQWLEILENEPANQAALIELSKIYNLPVTLVSTKVLADKLASNRQEAMKSEESAFYIVGLYEYIGDFSMARKVISEYFALYPGSLRAILTMGWEYYLEKKYSESLQWYHQAIDKFPQSLEGFHGKMLVLTAEGKTTEAKSVGNYILYRDPQNITAILRMGNMAYAGKQYNVALQYYSLMPTNIDCKLGIGLCYYKLGKFDSARPLLLEAYKIYPLNPNLIEALGALNEAEIKNLENELGTKPPSDRMLLREKQNRLIFLYELNGHFLKAANMLISQMPKKGMNFEQILRVSSLLSLGGKFNEAGQDYELAATISPNPRLTKLAAVDSYIAARSYDRAEIVLNQLRGQKSGTDLDVRYATLFSLTKQYKKARNIYNSLGLNYEATAKTSPYPQSQKLAAVDAYLNGRSYQRAVILLNQLSQEGLKGYELDRRLARLHFEQKSYSKAIAIYSKYPNDLGMQISKGWALVAIDHLVDAEKAFKLALLKYPKSMEAKGGYQFTHGYRPWDIFAIVTNINYGGYQDSRRIVTENLKYAHRKVAATFSHSRTDVVSLTPGNVDYNEDLYGLKLYYQVDPKNGIQAHFMTFQNDDVKTDESDIVGLAYFYYPTERWVLGLEHDVSAYRTAKAH
ncbi:hypothetical protein HYY75_11625, partial [bacterium]|nr:hypothetical protein [bacterium]